MERTAQIDRALNIYSNPSINPDAKKKHLTWLLGRIGQQIVGEEPNIPGFSVPTVAEMRIGFSSAVNELLEKLGWAKFQERANIWREANGERQGGKSPWCHRNEKFFRSAISRWTGLTHDGQEAEMTGTINEETARMFRDLLIEARQ